jgi:hypothetical protein
LNPAERQNEASSLRRMVHAGAMRCLLVLLCLAAGCEENPEQQPTRPAPKPVAEKRTQAGPSDASPLDVAPGGRSSIPRTPGALAVFPDSPLVFVEAMGERRIVLKRTNLEIEERKPDGGYKWVGNPHQPEQILVMDIDGGQPVPIAIATLDAADCADATDYVWLEKDESEGVSKVMMVRIDGAAPRLLAQLEGIKSTDLACSATAVVVMREGELVRIDKKDGRVTRLARGKWAPSVDGFTADDKNAYWFDERSSSIYRAPLRGGRPARIARTRRQAIATSLRVEQRGLFWEEGKQLRRLPPGARRPVDIETGVVGVTGAYYSKLTARRDLFALDDAATRLVKVASGVDWNSGLAVRGDHAAWLVRVAPVKTAPGEWHLVRRALAPSAHQ